MSKFEISIAIMAFLILAFVTSIPLFENYKKYSLLKRIYISIAVALLFVVGSFDVYLKCTDPSESDKVLNALKRLESAIGIKGKSPLAKSDSPKKVVTIIPIIKYKNAPSQSKPKYGLLKFLPSHDAPSIGLSKNKNKDSVIVSYLINNYGTGDAYNIKISTFCVWIINGEVEIQEKVTPQKYNSSMIIYAKEFEVLPGTTIIKGNIGVPDSTFFCYKIDFTDDTKKLKSFAGIYRLDTKLMTLPEVENGVYEKIKQYLIKDKYWKPPFRQ